MSIRKNSLNACQALRSPVEDDTKGTGEHQNICLQQLQCLTPSPPGPRQSPSVSLCVGECSGEQQCK